MSAHEIPYLGLGIGTNLGPADVPDPFALLGRGRRPMDYVEYSAPLDLDEAMKESEKLARLYRVRNEVQGLFHPVHLNLWGPEPNGDDELAALDRHLREMRSPWVSNDLGWWRRNGKPFPGFLFIPPLLTPEAVAECAAHIRRLQRAVGVPVAVENPPYQAVIGDLHVLDFMARVQEATGCELLLDMGHLYSHNLARGLPPDAGLDGFPFDRVIEVHIAGGALAEVGGRTFYTDDHTQSLHAACLALLRRIVPRCSRLRALTYEADGQPETLVARVLGELRSILPPRPQAPVYAARAPADAPEIGDAPPATGPARAAQELVFELAHGASSRRSLAGDPEAFLKDRGLSDEARHAFANADPLGLEADGAYRAAATAHRIDRVYPWTRLVLLAAGDSPEGFLESPEYRLIFEMRGISLSKAFERYASRFCREHTQVPGLERPVVFEVWKQLRGPPHVPWRRGPEPADAELARMPLGLSPAASLRSFGADLSEFRLALDRLLQTAAHRTRVLAATPLTGRVLAPLLDVAARALERPWPLLLHREPDGTVGFQAPTEPALFVLRLLQTGPATPAELLERLAPARENAEVLRARLLSVARGLWTAGWIVSADTATSGPDPMEAILAGQWLAAVGCEPLLGEMGGPG